MQAKEYRSNIISLQNHLHSAHAYRLIRNVPQSLHQSSVTYIDTFVSVDDIDWSFSSIHFYYVFGVMLPTFRIKTTLLSKVGMPNVFLAEN